MTDRQCAICGEAAPFEKCLAKTGENGGCSLLSRLAGPTAHYVDTSRQNVLNATPITNRAGESAAAAGMESTRGGERPPLLNTRLAGPASGFVPVSEYAGHMDGQVGKVTLPVHDASPLDGVTEEQLWTMVRVYHGFKTDAEMVDVLEYSLELYFAKMKEAIRAITPSPATTHGVEK